MNIVSSDRLPVESILLYDCVSACSNILPITMPLHTLCMSFLAGGNRRFRILVDLNLEKYENAKTKFDKSVIVTGILDAVREASISGGGFVRQVSADTVIFTLQVFDIRAMITHSILLLGS